MGMFSGFEKGFSPDYWLGKDPEVMSAPQAGKYTAEQQKLLKTLSEYYQQYSGDTTLPVYGGERIAPLTGMQTGALGALGGVQTPSYADIEPTFTGMVGEGVARPETLQALLAGSTGLQGSLDKFVSGEYATPSYLEDYYTQTVKNPLMRTWEEDVLPSVKGAFEKKGLMYGTGRMGAERTSAETLMNTLGKARAETMVRSEDLARERQLQAMGLSSNLIRDILAGEERDIGRQEQKPYNILEALKSIRSGGMEDQLKLLSTQMEMGDVPRQLEQAQKDIEYQNWLKTQPGTRPQDATIMQILGLAPMYPTQSFLYGGSEGTVSKWGSAYLGSGGMQAAMMG